MYLFNVRVYGILMTEKDEVLISDEKVQDFGFTKFPGGGLEYGEGLIDALKREFQEECAISIDIIRHIYTTDFYEKSSFNDSQIISIYYLVDTQDKIDIDKINETAEAEYANTSGYKTQKFRLVPLSKMSTEFLTFKTDKLGWQHCIDQNKKD